MLKTAIVAALLMLSQADAYSNHMDRQLVECYRDTKRADGFNICCKSAQEWRCFTQPLMDEMHRLKESESASTENLTGELKSEDEKICFHDKDHGLCIDKDIYRAIIVDYEKDRPKSKEAQELMKEIIEECK